MTESLIDFARSFDEAKRPVLDDIHPHAAEIVHGWLSDMFYAADAGDGHAVASIAERVNRKIDDEVAWQRHKQQFAQRGAASG
jgi:hypothetical protein